MGGIKPKMKTKLKSILIVLLVFVVINVGNAFNAFDLGSKLIQIVTLN